MTIALKSAIIVSKNDDGMVMNTLHMLVGLPGTGKSTFVTKFKERNDSVLVLSTDDYIEREAAKRGKTYGEVFDSVVKSAESAMMNDLRHCINSLYTTSQVPVVRKRNVVWDQTNLTVKSRARKLAQFPSSQNWHKIAYVFSVPDDIWIRLSDRYKMTGKFISTKLFENMRASFVMPTLEEGFDEIIIDPQ